MNFIQAIKKAKKKARSHGEEVLIVHDPIQADRPQNQRYYPADDNDLAQYFHSAEVIAVVYPDGTVE